MGSISKRRAEDLVKQVEEWNAAHAIGTDVIVTKDLGEQFPTKTRSPAWVLSGHTPVIMVNGISGCYLLDRVRPA